MQPAPPLPSPAVAVVDSTKRSTCTGHGQSMRPAAELGARPPQPQPPSARLDSSSLSSESNSTPISTASFHGPGLLLSLFSFATTTEAGSSLQQCVSEYDCDPRCPFWRGSWRWSSLSSLRPPTSPPDDPKWLRTGPPSLAKPAGSAASNASSHLGRQSQIQRRRGPKSKLEPLVRLFIFALLVYELLHLASLEWNQRQQQQPKQQLFGLRLNRRRITRMELHTNNRDGHGAKGGPSKEPTSLNNLINWPSGEPASWQDSSRRRKRPSAQPPLLRSMVVSLFAFPLCQANELVGQLSGDKDKESPPASGLPLLAAATVAAPSPAPEVTGTTTSEIQTTRSNVTTYKEAEMPINLLADGQAVVADASGPSASASSRLKLQPRQLESDGQNNSNNNNNNETANRNPQPGGEFLASAPTPGASAPTVLPSLAGAAASVSSQLEQQQQQQQRMELQLQVQTTGPKSGSYAQAFDPNSSNAGKTKQARPPPKEEANLTMTMTRPSLAKKMRQMQSKQHQQLQQQQQHLTMTSKSTRPGKDSSWSLLAGVEDKSAAMNSVVCNSRCQCVQLEFVADDSEQQQQLSRGEQGEAAAGLANSGGPASGGIRRPNCRSQPSETTAKAAKATLTTTTTTNGASSSESSSSGSSLSNNNNVNGKPNQNDDASSSEASANQAAPEQQGQCDESGQDSSSGNRIALIEFSQDYSFDDELADAAGDSATGSPDDELGVESSAKSEQTTTATGNGPQQQHQHKQHDKKQEPPVGRASGGGDGGQQAPTATPSDGADRPPVGPSAQSSTIKQADDQSKVVNVSSALGPAAPGGLGASRLMLSIKDNKTGPGAATTTATTTNGASPASSPTRDAGEESPLQVRVVADGNEQHATDKESGLSTQLSSSLGTLAAGRKKPLAQPQQQQPEPASAGNFYPFLGDHHHLHQRHHLADHQMGPAVAGLPSASFMVDPAAQAELMASRQRKGPGAGMADDNDDEHGPSRDGRPGGSGDNQAERPIKSILPLRSRSIIAGALESPEEMVDLLKDIRERQVQSVSLRSSRLKFELWTEIYGLLAIEMRRNLFHLDLAHNDLVKLGVTFTGYIEHHLAYQLLVHNNQSWPFPNAHSAQAQSTPNSTQQQPIGNNNRPASQAQSLSTPSTATTTTTSSILVAGLASAGRRPQLRHPNLGDGRLFNAVRSPLPVDIDSLILHQRGNHPAASRGSARNSNLSSSSSAQTANHLGNTMTIHPVHPRARLQQNPTVLHQPSRLKALDLSHNKLRWLINDQFRILKHVESIRLDHNQIRFIHQQAFNGLESLKYLNLNYNRIQTIYMEQFQTNYNLLALFMRSNYLTFLRAGSFASLNQLKRLDLSKNRFTFLSNNAFVGLDSLKLLNLSSNQFVHVPSTSFHSLAARMKTLDLSRNLLAQLMPGTFFHLKLERLLLNNNDQLVGIDRGAFWDLPYLSYLSLASSQVLISINSQAFVGVPNLATINYDDCQLLDADTKQMLDNITSATSLRQLKQQQQQLANGSGDHVEPISPVSSASSSSVMSPMKLTAGGVARQQMSAAAMELGRTGLMGPMGVGSGGGTSLEEAPAVRGIVKYVYMVACVMLIVIALKLVFKYTSTRHYLDARRRRRRVYQSSCSSTLAPSESSVGSNGPSRDNGSQASLDLESSVDSLDDKSPESSISAGASGSSFMMRELQPHYVIVGTGNSSENIGHQVDQPAIEIATEAASAAAEPPPDDESSVVVEVTNQLGEGDGLQQHQIEQEFNLELHHEPYLSCYDCCNQQCGVAARSEMIMVHEDLPMDGELNETGIAQSSLDGMNGEGPLQEGEVAFEATIEGQQQLMNQSQICDNMTSTSMEDGQIEQEIRRESSIQEDHLIMANHSSGPLNQAEMLDGVDVGGCDQHLEQLASAASANHLELIHQSSNSIIGAPLYDSFGASASQPSRRWADQTDCRLFHCACMRCGGPDLVGVNGYI